MKRKPRIPPDYAAKLLHKANAGKPMLIREVAAFTGLSKAMVHKIELEALEKLRWELRGEESSLHELVTSIRQVYPTHRRGGS